MAQQHTQQLGEIFIQHKNKVLLGGESHVAYKCTDMQAYYLICWGKALYKRLRKKMKGDIKFRDSCMPQIWRFVIFSLMVACGTEPYNTWRSKMQLRIYSLEVVKRI